MDVIDRDLVPQSCCAVFFTSADPAACPVRTRSKDAARMKQRDDLFSEPIKVNREEGEDQIVAVDRTGLV